MSLEAVLIHEMIHAMMGTLGVHAESGVFSEYSTPNETINDDTLSVVCTHVACQEYRPEVAANKGVNR
jgi:hypothetical protein